MSVTISGDTGVSKVQDGVIVQADLASGVAGNGPAFRATSSGTQTINQNATVKITFNAETFDTNSNFDTTTYRFTPTVAGYYLAQGAVQWQGGTYGSGVFSLQLFKNGSQYSELSVAPEIAIYEIVNGADLVYMNGTTDYIEIYFFQNQPSSTVQGIAFSGALVRAA